MDRDLHDDMLKLVRYKILFVKREYEFAFPEQEDLVSDNMDASAFTAWKIAQFIQDLNQTDGTARVRVPSKWGTRYPSDQNRYVRDGYLIGFPPEDKKYLRVYYEVLDRYPREKFKYEEQQIEVLREIRDRLPGERTQ
jgi:fructose-1,6-bisphosphatase